MSGTEWLTKVPVECTNCGHEVVTNFDSIEARETIVCSDCNNSFHIFDVYDRYYEEEPLVKSCVDFILKYVNQPYKIESEDKDSREALERFLMKINFKGFSEGIFNNLTKYGDSYLLIKRSQDGKEIVDLEPLEPRTIHIELGEEIRRGRGWTGEREVVAYMRKTETEEESFDPTVVVHLKKRDYSPYKPYGESVMRIALRYIHYLRTSRVGAMAAGAQWWIDHLQNGISLGIGVPPILLKTNLTQFPKTLVDMASTYFIGTINRLHWATRPLERDVFTELIKSRNLPEVPRLEWQRVDSTKIMKDGGFTFLEAIEALKKLHDLGIITEKEYREAISKYLPER